MAVLSGAAHRDGIDAVGVAIAGAVVPFSSSVPRGPDKDGAQTLAALHEARRRGFSSCGGIPWGGSAIPPSACFLQGSDGARNHGGLPKGSIWVSVEPSCLW